jgi:hypothetical protein
LPRASLSNGERRERFVFRQNFQKFKDRRRPTAKPAKAETATRSTRKKGKKTTQTLRRLLRRLFF